MASSCLPLNDLSYFSIHLLSDPAAGTAYTFAGDTEWALAIYNEGLSLEEYPLLPFRRGLLYGEIGEAE